MSTWTPIVIDGGRIDLDKVEKATGRPLGRDGTPVVWAVDEIAELCARHVDMLAGEVEKLADSIGTQAHALNDGRIDDARKRSFAVYGSLRWMAGELGHLHAVLDELAAQGPHGGAS